MSRRPRPAVVDLLVSLAVAVAVLAPVLVSRGYLLRGDLVFVPDQPWKAAWLGLDGRTPRFVPGDAFLAAAGSVLPGDLVQKGVLVLVFVLGGCGIGRLVCRLGGVARAAAITFFLWNPWVFERLAIGQWGVVVGYALLPWVVVAGERVRDGDRKGWPAVLAWLGLAAVFSPASGLVALVVVVSVLGARPRAKQLAVALAGGFVVNLPWILPALLTSPTLRAATNEFAAFGPRTESGLGVVGSLLSLGGIWKSSIVPVERTSALVVACSLVITVAGCVGLWWAARTDRARVAGLAGAAVAAMGLGLLTAVPSVGSALEELAADVPAVGILRDSHRYLGPVALALSVGLAVVADRCWQRATPGREALRGAAVLVVVAPLLLLPSFAWGLGGLWRPVSYPSEWTAVRHLVPPGRTVVLPWAGGYRGFAWNGRHAGLDPAQRFFPGDVLIDDRLLVGNEVLASEDPLLDDVRRALGSDEPVWALKRLGVRGVLVEKDSNGSLPRGLVGTVLHDGPELELLDLGPVAVLPPGRPSPQARAGVVVADVLVLTTWVAASGLALTLWIRGRRRSTCMVRPHSDTGGSP